MSLRTSNINQDISFEERKWNQHTYLFLCNKPILSFTYSSPTLSFLNVINETITVCNLLLLFIYSSCTWIYMYICIYEITELLRALWLVNSRVYMRVCKHRCDVLDSCMLLRLFYKSSSARFSVFTEPHLITRGWENSRKLCEPSTPTRVCITVSNSLTLLVFRWGYINTEKCSIA